MIDIYQLINSQLTNQIPSVSELSSLAQLPCYVYWKDKKGNYLDSNDYIMMHTGMNVIGLSDADFCHDQTAQQLKANDQLIIAQMQPRIFIERVHYLNGQQVMSFSYKAPIHNRLKKNDRADRYFFPYRKRQGHQA